MGWMDLMDVQQKKRYRGDENQNLPFSSHMLNSFFVSRDPLPCSPPSSPLTLCIKRITNTWPFPLLPSHLVHKTYNKHMALPPPPPQLLFDLKSVFGYQICLKRVVSAFLGLDIFVMYVSITCWFSKLMRALGQRERERGMDEIMSKKKE